MIGYIPINSASSHLAIKGIALTLLYSTCLSVSPSYAIDPATVPSGGSVAGGQASINYDMPQQAIITQQSDRAVINWNQFNIGTDASVAFNQPDTSSVTVNRVTGNHTDPTQIMGTLTSNGTVMVLDKQGVVFGKQSRVDVGGLIASSADIDDNAFMRGDDTITLRNSTNDAHIINHGHITARDAGLVSFVAPHIHQHGTITATTGRVQLGAGTQATIDLYGDGLLELAPESAGGTISHRGITDVGNGDVQLTAAAAQHMVDSVVNMDGIIDATSASTSGGTITLEGDHITVSGTLNTDGATGGGTILVGGDYQGGGTLARSDTTYITETANISANATDHGDGGNIIIWSDESSIIDASMHARGGVHGGDGGFIETSSAQRLQLNNTVSMQVGAPHGDGGTWLLDPEDISITDAGDDGNASTNDVSTASINATLNGGGDVLIKTNAGGFAGNIIISNANIDYSISNGDATLELQADNTIRMANSSIDSSSGDKLNVIFNADRDASGSGAVRVASSTINTRGGHFIAGGGSGAVGGANSILGDGDGTGPDDVYAFGDLLNSTYRLGVELINMSLTTAEGNIILNGKGRDGINFTNGVRITGNATLTTTSGDILVDGMRGSSGNGATGVVMQASDIVTDTGAVTMKGIGGGSANSGRGIYLLSDATITSSGTTGAGAITLDGLSTEGTEDSDGITIKDTSIITSSSANIIIKGKSESVDVNATDTHGVRIESASRIVTNGSGNITIEGTGATNSDDSDTYGVLITDNNTDIVTTDSGSITITGTGKNDQSSNRHHGVVIANEADVTSSSMASDGGNITITGISGDGVDSNYGVYITDEHTDVTSSAGNIAINGTANGVGESNVGVAITNKAKLMSEGATSDAATISINGIAADGTNNNSGVLLADEDTKIISTKGDITITGTGGSDGSGDLNHGIALDGLVRITSDGTGIDAANITLSGTSGSGDDNNNGIYHGGAYITTDDGNISLTGTGKSDGSNGNDDNSGLYIHSNSRITSSGSGINAGTITLLGTGANGGSNNSGITIGNSVDPIIISATDGNISLTGNGGTNGNAGHSGAHGIASTEKLAITSDGTGANAATITLQGTAGAGDSDNVGVKLAGSTVSVASHTGNILIEGNGNSVGAGNENYGVHLDDSVSITSNGNNANAATITIDGTGGNGQANNYGIYASDNSTITATFGDINLDGTGGTNGALSSDNGIGLHFDNGIIIDSQGTDDDAANITLSGTGANGDDNNHGIRFSASSTNNTVKSVAGDIEITGTAGTNGDAGSNTNNGLFITNKNTILSAGNTAGAGTITLTGIGKGVNSSAGIILGSNSGSIDATSGDITLHGTSLGTGTDAFGIRAFDKFHVTSRGDAAITITGVAGATGDDVSNDAFVGEGNADGDITYNVDSIAFSTRAIETTGDIRIAPRTATTTIGLGNGAGTLNLSNSELALLHAGGQVIIGDSSNGTGAITIDSADISAKNYDLALHGGDTTINGLDVANQLLLLARGDVTIDGAISTTAAGDTIIIDADTITNNAGAMAIDPGTGRFILYADSFDTSDTGGLAGSNVYGVEYATTPPASVTHTGNLYAYAQQPTITVTVDDAIQKGSTVPPLTYTIDGVRTGDAVSDAYTGLPDVQTGSKLTSKTFSIDATIGTLTSSIGYIFDFVSGVLTVKEKAPIDVVADVPVMPDIIIPPTTPTAPTITPPVTNVTQQTNIPEIARRLDILVERSETRAETSRAPKQTESKGRTKGCLIKQSQSKDCVL